MRTWPQVPTDGYATDRALLLDFHASISAEEVRVVIVDSMAAG